MALQHDHISVNTPDLHKPFDSPEDAIARLLPYHVYRIPEKDLTSIQDNEVEGQYIRCVLIHTAHFFNLKLMVFGAV